MAESNVKTVSSFRVSKTAEGNNIEYVYSVVDENGEYIQRNLVKNLVAVNPKIVTAINTINDFLVSKIPDIEQ